MKRPFKFLRPGRLVDGELELVLLKTTQADPAKGYVPGYWFEMRRAGKKTVVGSIRLRIGSEAELRLVGNIGYDVKKRYRGHRYAGRSARLLLPLAAAHGLKSVWLTVDPKNIPSLKTCRNIGAKYVETVRIPRGHEMYKEGARYRRRHRLGIRR